MAISLSESESGAVQRWIEDIIIGLNLCPFAKKPYIANKVAILGVSANKLPKIANEVLQACKQLDSNDAIETTLLVFPQDLRDFNRYLDALEYCEIQLEEAGYIGTYQLASFHPEYVFAGEAPDDASNYTNKAPFPIIHIIRESSIDAVLKTYRDPEAIPERNIALMQDLGIEHLRNRFAAFLK